MSRWQQKIEGLVGERRQLRKQWKRAEQSQKEGPSHLQRAIKDKLATLRRAEHLWKCYKKKEFARANFYKDPFKFVKKLFTREKNGTLKASSVELERYWRKRIQMQKGMIQCQFHQTYHLSTHQNTKWRSVHLSRKR